VSETTLTVVVPARNERWLGLTCKDVLANSGERTTVLVILDGEWPEPDAAPEPHPRLDVIKLPKAIGQRAATNLGIKIARTTYAMKLDAHCSMAPGFDVELMKTAEELGPDVVQIPGQYNLHVFNRVCPVCRYKADMGPTWVECPNQKCKSTEPMVREIVWQRRPNKSKYTTSWMFDRTLHFHYWGQWGDAHAKEEVHDVMSCLGACWFVNREWYWTVDGLDESHGSWGQMGTEIACKAWLSGGRMVVNKRTWFAHMFRTQGGDFGFPYPLSGNQVSTARKRSKELWLKATWPKATRSLSWLLHKFAPFPDPDPDPGKNQSWTAEDIASLDGWEPPVPAPTATKGIVWYSDAFGRGDEVFQEIVRASWRRLTAIAPDIPIVAVVLGDLQLPERQNATIIRLKDPRGYLTMFRQIQVGLATLKTDIAYLCEHDVLYAREHFELPVRDDRPSYNQNVWKVDAADGKALHYLCSQTSGLSCNRKILAAHYDKRVIRLKKEGEYRRTMGFEPGTRQLRHGGFDDMEHDVWFATKPNVDIRHGSNLTPSRWKKEQFRHQRFTKGWTEGDGVPGWGTTRNRFREWLDEVVENAVFSEVKA
jgi:hypothetical protein